MKTIEVKLYSFDELSSEAKQKAMDYFVRSECEFEPFYVQDANESLKKFAKIFGVDYSEIDYLESYRNRYKLCFDDQIKNLSGVRLISFLWNNFKRDLFKGKYYPVKSNKPVNHKRVKSQKLHNGNIFNAYYSSIQLDNSCVLTGVCYDDDILQPIYDFMNKPSNTTFEELIDECILSLCKAVESEFDYHTSEEGIRENCEANEYWFTEDGKLAS